MTSEECEIPLTVLDDELTVLPSEYLRLEAVNAVMLEALKAVIAADGRLAQHRVTPKGVLFDDPMSDAVSLARAAIAAAEPETEQP